MSPASERISFSGVVVVEILAKKREISTAHIKQPAKVKGKEKGPLIGD